MVSRLVNPRMGSPLRSRDFVPVTTRGMKINRVGWILSVLSDELNVDRLTLYPVGSEQDQEWQAGVPCSKGPLID